MEKTQEAPWITKAQEGVSGGAASETLSAAKGFLSSRWKVALLAALVGSIVVFFMSPPMIHDDKGRPEIAKAMFWGSVAGVMTFVLPWILFGRQEKGASV